MKQSEVEYILKDDPERVKEIRLNDGRRYRVRERERWMAGPYLVLLDERNDFTFIAYHNISAIRSLQRNGGRRSPRRQ
ncbi:MAG: hypothetical protein HYY17_06810 [Planctomycetes bacterium]|nr:hypothetical protein [Planctomycetota bacterium]